MKAHIGYVKTNTEHLRFGFGGIILILPCISSCVISATFSLPDGDEPLADFDFFSGGRPAAVLGIALKIKERFY